MHELDSCSGGRVACDSASREASMRDETVFCVTNSRYHAIRRLIAFASAVDIRIECFNGSRQRSEVFS
jgi:hypothetical protein